MLVEVAEPLLDAIPEMRPHVETIRRFSGGGFVPKEDLLRAAQKILQAIGPEDGVGPE